MKRVKLNKLIDKLLNLLKKQGGGGIISGLYTMLILTMIFFIGIDVAGYTGTMWKLRNACNETLALMKMENGFDSGTASVFYNFLLNQGLDISRVKVNGTPKTVQRGEMITITASIPYDLRALRPINKQISFEVRVEMSGLAQEFIR